MGADDAWAVGGFRSFGNTPGESPLIEHWDSRKWTAMTVPRLAHGASASQQLIGVAGSSPDDVWALGHSSSNGATYMNRLLHWDGRSWRLVPSPQSHAAHGVSLLMGVAVDRAGRAWAVGGRLHGIGEGSTFDGALVETWNGSSWREAQSPGGALPLIAVATAGPHAVWAIRRPFLSASPESYEVSGAPGLMSVMRWTNAGWVTTLSTEGVLNDIAVADSQSAWVVGARRGPLLLHWNGASWTRITGAPPVKLPAGLSAVTVAVNKDVLALGVSGLSPGSQNALWAHCA